MHNGKNPWRLCRSIVCWIWAVEQEGLLSFCVVAPEAVALSFLHCLFVKGNSPASAQGFVKRLWCRVKYEDVYLKSSTPTQQIAAELTKYLAFLPQKELCLLQGSSIIADEVFRSMTGGVASVVEKFSEKE